MKRYVVGVLSILFLAALLLVAWHESKRHRIEIGLEPVITTANAGCVDCHRKDSPALVMEWEHSRHAHYGVGCYDCHRAEEGKSTAGSMRGHSFPLW